LHPGTPQYALEVEHAVHAEPGFALLLVAAAEYLVELPYTPALVALELAEQVGTHRFVAVNIPSA
jgi:hypothetical protein